MSKIKFLSIEEAFVIHERMIEIGGGSFGIRDIELLHAAVERPRLSFSGKYLYDSIWKMAAVIIQSIIKNHPFIDGNKRTGFFAALRFLNINNIELRLDDKDIVRFVLEIDIKNRSIKEIANWLKKHKNI